VDLTVVKGNIAQYGLARALADVALRSVNRVVLARILKAILIETVDPAFLECAARYEGGFFEESVLREFAADARNELPHAFLDDALAKGDECYGFRASGVLAAYGWYSHKATAIDLPGLELRFGPEYVYMYKGFTASAHRGQRLHAVGMTRALQAYLARGYRGIVSYVEWNNFGSLRSCYRMGYRDFGRVAIAGAGGHYALHHDAGCRKLGFELRKIPSRGGAASGAKG
jgi:hypothetical protein